MSVNWTVIVPVKGMIGAKTRLDLDLTEAGRGALGLAFGRDTIAAARATDGVERVIVVTDEPLLQSGDRVKVVSQGPIAGLNAAVMRGVAVAPDGYGVAVLLGDQPALRPGDLAEALELAAQHPLGFVPDADGTGTTLLTALRGSHLSPSFGQGSAAAHRESGHVELPVSPTTTLRRDVDTGNDLAVAISLGVGPATRALLGLDSD